MDKKIKIMWILNILMWLCWLSSVIVRIFSSIASYVLLGCWGVCVTAIIIIDVLIAIDLKRQEREYNQIEADTKHLEELIKGYLTISLESEKENKED